MAISPTQTTDADAASSEYKLCPICGRTTPAANNRCQNCWNEIINAAVLEPEHAIRIRAREDARDVARERAISRRQTRLRVARFVVLGVLVGLMGWWIFATFIYEPPPVPLPISQARAVTVGPDSWPLSGGDLSGRRVTSAPAHLGGEIDWSIDLGASPVTSLVADERRLFATLADGRIVGIEATNGRVLWTYDVQNAPFAAPTVAGDRLYVPLRQGQLLALDVESGALAFSSDATQTSFGASPLVLDGVAYVFGTGRIFGFDAETGDELWNHLVDSSWAFVAPVVEGPHIAVATGDKTLIFDRVSGQQTYYYEFARAHPYSIVLADGTVYSLSSRFGAALDVQSRRPWWEGWRTVWNQFWLWGMAPTVPAPPSLWVASRPPQDGYAAAVAPDRLLLASPEGDLRAISRSDGASLWTTKVDRIVEPPTLTADGLLLTHETRLALYDPSTGQERASRPLEVGALHGSVVTRHGTYVTTAAGRLLALR